MTLLFAVLLPLISQAYNCENANKSLVVYKERASIAGRSVPVLQKQIKEQGANNLTLNSQMDSLLMQIAQTAQVRTALNKQSARLSQAHDKYLKLMANGAGLSELDRGLRQTVAQSSSQNFMDLLSQALRSNSQGLSKSAREQMEEIIAIVQSELEASKNLKNAIQSEVQGYVSNSRPLVLQLLEDSIAYLQDVKDTLLIVDGWVEAREIERSELQAKVYSSEQRMNHLIIELVEQTEVHYQFLAAAQQLEHIMGRKGCFVKERPRLWQAY